MRKTISLDLRERILECYDSEDGTRDQAAKRFRVSLGMVKKLLQQRKDRQEIGAQHYRSGRKPIILEKHREQMKSLLIKKPDLTLNELKGSLGLECSLTAIHHALEDMKLTYKKRHSEPASKTVKTSLKHAKRG